MDLEISPRDIDHTYTMGVLSKGKNKTIDPYYGQALVFTNKKRLKGKNMPITKSLTKIKLSVSKEARNKCLDSRQKDNI